VDRPLPVNRTYARRRRVASGQEARASLAAGTFPTDGLFVGLLIGVILIMGGLIYFPALALGPIEEHLAMRAGVSCETFLVRGENQ
jgi:hypothetical protein